MIFNSDFTVTQYFGVNKAYYQQFDLEGHDGVDLVPMGNDWTIKAYLPGVVMDLYYSTSYGNTIITYDAESKLAVRYAHLEEIYVQKYQGIQEGKEIGTMGDSGNAHGAHLHTHIVPMGIYGEKLHPDNGYKGRFDPLPLIIGGQHGYIQ